jgi:F420-dependent oxidoreductase-like protein
MSKPLPSPSLVVLIGAPASGKSTWAAENFHPSQIVSSDHLRGVIGEHDLDLSATDDAFELLDQIVQMRLGRGLTTVIDTTGLDSARRSTYLALSQRFDVPAVAVRFSTTAAECKRRNRERSHPVPAKAIDAMAKLARSTDLTGQRWETILEPEPVRMVTAKLADAALEARDGSLEALEERPFGGLRFGLLVSRFNFSGGNESIGPTLARIARQAEEAGFDSLWVMDHMIQIPQVGSTWDPMLDSYTTLGFLANATSKMRLGVLVSAVTFRNVGHLAKMIATLDVLSGGRAIAGLGAANSKHEHDAYGLEFPEAHGRLARLEDVLQALPLLWGPGSPAFEGKTLSVPDTTSYPRPIQDPVPIIVGGSGERVTLRLAAEYAAGCNLFGDVAAVRRRIDVVRRHCTAVGRDFADFEVTHLGEVLIGRDPLDLSDRIERLRPSNVGPDRYAASANAGTVEDHEAGFRSLAAAGVQTAIVSTPDLEDSTTMALFADVISRLSPIGREP